MLPRLKFLCIALLTLFGFVNAIPTVWAAGVVGTGTAGSCTRAALQAAIDAGNGTITFNCGGVATIAITTTLNVDASTGAKNITIDGGGLITLDGGNTTRIFIQDTWGTNGSTLTLQNLTLAHGRASAAGNGSMGGAVFSHFGATQANVKPFLNIDNVTFSNNASVYSAGGAAEYGGGAIFSWGGFVNITNSSFISNTASGVTYGGYGAAIHILQSAISIDNTTFTNNTATNQGGAIYIDGLGGASGVFSLTNSSFTGSRAHNSGGAIYVNMYENTSQFIVDRTSFVNNGVDGGNRSQGGAICGGSTTIDTDPGNTGNAKITITNSLFSQNFAYDVSASPGADGSGGALNFNQQAQITIANSTFDGNQAQGNTYGANGGAIVISGNTVQFQIINSTISNNYAGWVGGGIVASTLPNTLTPGGIIRNTIFANNTADNGPNHWNISQHCGSIDMHTTPSSAIPMLVNGGNNIQYPAKLTTNWNDKDCATGITIADPLLAPLTNNGGPTQTRALQAGSPAIDTGSNTVCAAAPVSNLDQRGQSRPIDGDGLNGAQCDVGAFEFVSNQPPYAPTLTTPTANLSLLGTLPMFTWAQAPFASSYHLLIDDDADFLTPIVDQTLTGTSFAPSYIGVGGFHWKVTAINVNGSAESASRDFTLGSLPAAVPTRNFTIATSQTLTWTSLSWAVGYRVEIATDMAFAHITQTSPNLAASASSYSVSLDPGVYYWRVTGMKSPGVWGSPSAAEMLTVGSN
ncbi:MAG: choice-of-anchor Q domain-containing protein [Chloroflexota bacterium]